MASCTCCIQPEYLVQPETWINVFPISMVCYKGMGMAITYSSHEKGRGHDLECGNYVPRNNSISIIAGLTVMMAVFSVVDDPLSAVSGGSSAITFRSYRVYSLRHLVAFVQLAMVAMFFWHSPLPH